MCFMYRNLWQLKGYTENKQRIFANSQGKSHVLEKSILQTWVKKILRSVSFRVINEHHASSHVTLVNFTTVKYSFTRGRITYLSVSYPSDAMEAVRFWLVSFWILKKSNCSIILQGHIASKIVIKGVTTFLRDQPRHQPDFPINKTLK